MIASIVRQKINPSPALDRASSPQCWVLAVFLLLAMGAGGCGSSGFEASPTAEAATGIVHGGRQPITGTAIQLYAVGATGDGSRAAPLLREPVTTSDGSGDQGNRNANAGNHYNKLPAGAFDITGDYECPSPRTEVYLAASGGNPGLASGASNASIALMAALGPCGRLSRSTYVSVNELTTVGSVAALWRYMSSMTEVGSTPAHVPELEAAFSQASEYVSASLGTVPGESLPAEYYASQNEIRTLGSILAACVNSTGGVAGDGSVCGRLFALVAPPGLMPPVETAGAVLSIVKYPSWNVAQIFNLLGSFAPFQPTLTSPPQSWLLPIVPFAAAPTITPGSGSYVGAQSVTLSSVTPGAVIYYTFDGSAPGVSSAIYHGPISVRSSGTLQAIAVAPGYAPSAVASSTFAISNAEVPPALPVTFSDALNQTTVFIGASIIQYWPLPMHNAGIAGQTTGQVLARFETDVVGHGYKRVVVLVGTNDIIKKVPGFPEEAAQNLASMAEIAARAGIDVVFFELPPTPYGDPDGTQVRALNRLIVDLGKRGGYKVVDDFTPLDGHPEYFYDGIHPIPQGYTLMEKALASVVTH